MITILIILGIILYLVIGSVISAISDYIYNIDDLEMIILICGLWIIILPFYLIYLICSLTMEITTDLIHKQKKHEQNRN